MKAKLSNFLILFLILPGIAQAGEIKGKYTKEKKISKSYTVNPNAELDVTNRYGSIYVTTWNEDKIAIDVVITVSGNNEDLVNKRLNSIDVNVEGLKYLVTAKTKISNFSGGKTSMEINYTIKIPAKGSIHLDNQYGNIKVGKIFSKAHINCKYGDVDIDELNSDDNILNIEYCGGSKIGYLKKAALSVKYSEVNLIRGGRLQAICEYTSLKIGDIDDLIYKCNYGDLNVANGDKITGSGNYLSSKFSKVNNLLNVTSNYGDLQIGGFTKNVQNVAINATYTGIDIKYSNEYSFDFEISMKYDRLEGGSDLKFQDKREKNTDAYYKGYHKNSGVNRIFIKSEYGHVNLKKI